jgi:hypothetical protein
VSISNGVRVKADVYFSPSEGTTPEYMGAEFLASVAASRCVRHKQNIGTAAEAINLATVAAARWCVFVNRDTTNYIELYTSNGGVIFAKLLAGECLVIPLGSGVTAPYAKANTAACELECLIVDT